MAGEHQVLLDRTAVSDLLERLLDTETPRIGEPSRRILLIVGPRRKGALAEAAHALGLIDANLLFLLGSDEDQGVVGSLHRVGEALGEPLTGMDEIALGYPVILLGPDADVELIMMVTDRLLREGDLPFASRFEVAQERVANRGRIETGRRKA